MPMFIFICSILGLTAYVAVAVTLILADPWWCVMIGAFEIFILIGVGVHLTRLVMEGRRRRRLLEFRRRMLMPDLLPMVRYEVDRS